MDRNSTTKERNQMEKEHNNSSELFVVPKRKDEGGNSDSTHGQFDYRRMENGKANIPVKHSSRPLFCFTKLNRILKDGLEFPLKEDTKQRFTQIYSVDQSRSKDSILLYGQHVEFSLKHMCSTLNRLLCTEPGSKEKRNEVWVWAIKEAFFIENVFGNEGVLKVAKLLMTRMGRTINVKETPKSRQSKKSRLRVLILIHGIMIAEAIQSLESYKPKVARPYSKAFSTDRFVYKFVDVVSALQSYIKNTQKLYWMRLIWESCLSDESLSKIDENGFWQSFAIPLRPLPARLQLKNKIELEITGDVEEEVTIIAVIDKNKKSQEIVTILID